MQACTVCKGSKVRITEAYTYGDVTYPERVNPCNACDGLGQFPEVNEAEIRSAIIATKGKNKGKLRASMTSRSKGIADDRAYYVWRIARFVSGIDTTMPVTADMMSRGDPYIKNLNVLADQVAKESFGQNINGVLRWGQALGF